MGWILLILIVVVVGFVISSYNGLVGARNNYKNAFAQIDVQLKRRYDLIPNLVEAAKGYLKHERETLEAVIKARNQAVAAAPVLTVVIAFQALQRTANFAISNPAREVLFTVVARDEKYKAKNVIDIVAVRGADAAGGWLFTALRSLGMELRSIPLVAILIAAACLVLAAMLGRAQERRAAVQRPNT